MIRLVLLKKLKGREQHHTDRGSLTLITLVRFLFLFLVRKRSERQHPCVLWETAAHWKRRPGRKHHHPKESPGAV